MKLFFIVQNGTTVPNDPKFIVSIPDEKIKILNQLNIIGVDLDNYTIYDESSLLSDSPFLQTYEQAVLNHYFPPIKQGNVYIYYPESKIINTSDGCTIYVCRWEQLDARKFKIQSMTYFCDDSEKEEYQRVLFMFISQPKEENGCD